MAELPHGGPIPQKHDVITDIEWFITPQNICNESAGKNNGLGKALVMLSDRMLFSTIHRTANSFLRSTLRACWIMMQDVPSLQKLLYHKQ